MKEFLLNKKWVGAVALLIYVAAVAVFWTGVAEKFVKQVAPIVEREVIDFAPIKFENGVIVEPKDTIISKTYGQDNTEHKIVLDTRADEFESSVLKEKGVYLSRKYMYLVTDRKTEIHSFQGQPDMVIDEEVVRNVGDEIQNKSGKYIFTVVFIAFWIFSAVLIGLYSLAMNWALTKLFNNTFAQTLRINTLVYIVISALSVIAGFNIGFLISFLLMCCANYIVNKSLAEDQKA